jgi:hypothetical protein
MNNFFKIDQSYNIRTVNIPLPFVARQMSTTNRLNTSTSKIASLVKKMEDIQTIPLKRSPPNKSTSYPEQINKILTNWKQIQQAKKKYQQQQQVQPDQDKVTLDFDRIMEEDLGNQLKVLERQEEEQYQLMEQIIEKQMTDTPEEGKVDDIEQFNHHEELATLIEDQDQEEDQIQGKQQFLTWRRHERFNHLKRFNKYRQQQQFNLDIWKQKQGKEKTT